MERTSSTVRSIAAAKEEVTQTRAMLENVLGLVTHVHDAANGLDHRKRQVEQAEERLARAEAMLAEVQAGLEHLHGQKALLDQAVTQASALEFQTKQAETVIAALRQEREITDTGPTASQRISLSARTGSAGAPAATGAALADVVVTGSGGSVKITSAQMVLSRIKLASDAACTATSDTDADEPNETPDAETNESNADNHDESECPS